MLQYTACDSEQLARKIAMVMVDQKRALMCEIISLKTKKAMRVSVLSEIKTKSVELESKEKILQSYTFCNKQFTHALFYVTKITN